MKKDKTEKENTQKSCECVTRALAFPERGACNAELFEKRDVIFGVSEKINEHYKRMSAALHEYAKTELAERYRRAFDACNSARERCAMRPYRVLFSVSVTSMPEENKRGIICFCVQYTLLCGTKTLKHVILRESWNARHGFLYTRGALLRLFKKRGKGMPYLEGTELMFAHRKTEKGAKNEQ